MDENCICHWERSDEQNNTEINRSSEKIHTCSSKIVIEFGSILSHSTSVAMQSKKNFIIPFKNLWSRVEHSPQIIIPYLFWNVIEWNIDDDPRMSADRAQRWLGHWLLRSAVCCISSFTKHHANKTHTIKCIKNILLLCCALYDEMIYKCTIFTAVFSSARLFLPRGISFHSIFIDTRRNPSSFEPDFSTQTDSLLWCLCRTYAYSFISN